MAPLFSTSSLISISLALVASVTATAIPAPQGQLYVGRSFSASFTPYGTGDANGSNTCTVGGACGLAWAGGPTAAVNTALYNAGACGTCWQLTSAYGGSIKVKVDNECPGGSNAPCNQGSLTSANYAGAAVHFDLCNDSGAQGFFGGQTLFQTGTATQVAC